MTRAERLLLITRLRDTSLTAGERRHQDWPTCDCGITMVDSAYTRDLQSLLDEAAGELEALGAASDVQHQERR